MKRNFYKLFILFVFFFISVDISFSAIFRGVGEAVVEGNDLKIAETNAKQNALEDAIYNYLRSKTTENNTIPEITSEYFKFLRAYKIISRNVANFKITYTIDADIIDFDIADVYHMVNKVVASAIYVMNMKGDLEDIDEQKINNIIKNKFNEYNIDTKYEEDYIFTLNDKKSTDEIVTQFANSKAQYLFIMIVDSNINKIDNKAYCRVELLTNIYTRENKNKPIKAISTSINEDPEKSFELSLNKSLDKMFNYVINNIIILNKSNSTIFNLKINFTGFKRIGEVYDILNFMDDRGLINHYNIEQFGREKILTEIKTIYSSEELVDKIKRYKENENFKVLLDSQGIELHFNSQ